MATWEAFWSKETVQPGVTYVAQKTISSFSPAPLTVYPILTVAPGVASSLVLSSLKETHDL